MCLASPQGDSHSEGAMKPRIPTKPFAPPPCYRRPAAYVKSEKAVATGSLKMTLMGLTPSNLHPDGVSIYMTSKMDVAPQFVPVSRVIGDDLDATVDLERLSSIGLIITFCNACDDDEVRLAQKLATHVQDKLDVLDRPPMILVPFRNRTMKKDKFFNVAQEALRAGFDGIIYARSEGHKFVYDVRQEISKHSRHIGSMVKSLHERHQELERVEKIRGEVNCVLWEFLPFRLRLGSSIPDLDADLDPSDPQALIDGKFALGPLLGRGAHGSVYRLEDHRHQNRSTGEVVKVIDKQAISSGRELKELSREIRVMQMLSTGAGRHPNIVQLHEVYNTREHILFRMQDGGSRNLFSYLKALRSTRLPLGQSKVEGIITQSLSAICHIHVGLHLAHRDIKPENFTISETPERGLVVKLCDFDLARVLPNDCQCSSLCGTFPFQAPEMACPPFNAFPADIWALGFVFLEVLCGCDVVTKTVVGGKRPANGTEIRRMIPIIGHFFGQPDAVRKMIHVNLRPELEDRLETATLPLVSMLEGMLQVSVAARSTAEGLQELLA